MDNEFLPFEFYYKCSSCHLVVYDPSWKSKDIDTPFSCCGAYQQSLETWPSHQIKKLLKIVYKQDINNSAQIQVAILFLCEAADILFEDCLLRLLSHKNYDKKINSSEWNDKNNRIIIYNSVSDCSLEELWKADELGGFFNKWCSLALIRDKIKNERKYEKNLDDINVFEIVRENYLKAFLILNNDVQRQIAHSEVYKSSQVVLVVDDEEEVTHHLKRFIERQGFKAITSLNGRDAVELYQTYKPDCVLLDVILPDMDGLKVLAKIKEDDPKANVYFITGIDGDAFHKEAKKLGAKGHLFKPIDLVDIRRILKSLKKRKPE